MAEPARAEPRYRAFLSYSHKDAAEAARIHRRLESYRLPKRLVGRETDWGPVPRRLLPIFRDREELAASSDLSETVRAALAESATLIVLCSPDAAASLWVSEEIRTFRALHPGRPVLAAILDGDPPHCFPDALRAQDPGGTWHEPLATDLRRQGDGPHLGLLKLVAGITGVPLDDLVQRDASRRIRRVTAVTVGALVAVLIMAALTVFALNSRREAERQRAEAEGLIEFMLTDLRQRLRGVGRLDIMQAVNERALQNYRNDELDDLTDDQLLRQARILIAVGQDNMRLGDLDAALDAFVAARSVTSEQVRRHQGDPRRLHEQARSEYRIGRVHEARREWARAERQYLRAAAAAERLLSTDRANPDYMMIVASTATDLGNIQFHRNTDPAAAERSYARAVQWFGEAVRTRPSNEDAIRAHANAYANLADTFFSREDWQAALAARGRQFQILHRLHMTQPANMETIYRLALAHRGLAASLAATGNPRSARTHRLQAYALAGRLARHDSRNAEWLLFRTMAGCDVYFRDVDLPGGITRRELAGRIRASASGLRRRNDPRLQLVSRCLQAIDS